jgi:excisionase family DNA binding protein
LTLDKLFDILYIDSSNMENKDLLTIDEVAEILKISRATVYTFINNKENPIPVVYLSDRTPRVKADELGRWVDRQTANQEQKTNTKEEKSRKGGEQ